MENVSNIITGLNIPDQIPLDAKAYCASEAVLASLGAHNNLAYVYFEGLVIRCQLEKTRWEWREVNPGERGLLVNDFKYPDNWIVYGYDYSLKDFNFFKVDYSSLDKDFSKIVYFNDEEPTTATIFDISNPPITNDDSLKEDDNNLYIGTDASSWIYDQGEALYKTYISSSNKSNFFITGTSIDAGGTKTGSITKKGEFVIDSEIESVSGLVLKKLVANSFSILKVDSFGNVIKTTKVQDIDYEPLIPNGLPEQYYGGEKIWKNFPSSFPPSAHTHLATEIVETANRKFQTSLQNQYNDATSSIQTQFDNLRDSIPDSYAQVVYVNSTSPTTATIFDTLNPPTTNDDSLKNNVANLYVGTDASTWVYQTSPAGYVTKAITSSTSNFYLEGTTTDAGGNKTSDIERSGKIKAGGFKVAGILGFLKSDGTIDTAEHELVSNKNVANGYPGLGADSKILASQLPPSKIKNSANVDQFTYLLDQGFQIAGAGDTSISFDSTNKRITITSTPGAGGGGAVTSFNSRTGGVVATEGDYSLNLLGDVTISSLVDKSMLLYNSATTQWENKLLNTSIIPELTNLYYTNARGIGSVLTGYVSSPGTVSATDTVLQAIQKVNGNIALKSNLSSPDFTGVPTAPTASSGVSTSQIATTAFVVNELAISLSNVVTLNTVQTITSSKTFGGVSTSVTFNNIVNAKNAIAFDGDPFGFGYSSSSPSIGKKNNDIAIYSTGTNGFASLNTSLISGGLNNKVFTFPNQDGIFALTNNPTSIIAVSFIKNGAPSTNILLAGGTDIPQSTFALASSAHNPVTLGTANGLSLATQVLSLGLAGSGSNGALSSTDWNTFNGKFPTPTGLVTNYLPKWNGSVFGDSSVSQDAVGNITVNGGPGSSQIKLNKPTGASIALSGSSTNYVVIEASNSVNPDMIFYTSGEKVRIKDNGRVLFNTPTDDLTNQLQVNGSGKFTGGLQATILRSTIETNNYIDLYGTTSDMIFNSQYGNPNGGFKFKRSGLTVFEINPDNTASFLNTITASPAVNSNQVVVLSQLDLKANLASPALTGTPTAPTATAGTNTTQVATTAFVTGALSTGGFVTLNSNQTITSRKTFQVNDNTNGGILITGVSGNNNTGVDIGSGGVISSFSSGIRISSISNAAFGILINNTTGANGRGIVINNTTGTGDAFVFQKNGSDKVIINDAGNITATSFNVSALNTAPATATSAGTLGEIRVTATHIYVCTAANTWVRSALTTW